VENLNSNGSDDFEAVEPLLQRMENIKTNKELALNDVRNCLEAK
jgi:hypothetical protein